MKSRMGPKVSYNENIMGPRVTMKKMGPRVSYNENRMGPR